MVAGTDTCSAGMPNSATVRDPALGDFVLAGFALAGDVSADQQRVERPCALDQAMEVEDELVADVGLEVENRALRVAGEMDAAEVGEVEALRGTRRRLAGTVGTAQTLCAVRSSQCPRFARFRPRQLLVPSASGWCWFGSADGFVLGVCWRWRHCGSSWSTRVVADRCLRRRRYHSNVAASPTKTVEFDSELLERLHQRRPEMGDRELLESMARMTLGRETLRRVQERNTLSEDEAIELGVKAVHEARRERRAAG